MSFAASMRFRTSLPTSTPTDAITRSKSWRKITKGCGSAAVVVTTHPRNSMAGYSGTSLPKKLGIKPNYRAAFLDLPAEVKAELHDALSPCHFAKDGRLDFAMIFKKDKAELKKQFSKLAKQLAPSGMLWVSWPKKSSGVLSDLDENIVRSIGLNVFFSSRRRHTILVSDWSSDVCSSDLAAKSP